MLFTEGGAPMETPDLSTLSDNIDSTDDLVPSLQVYLIDIISIDLLNVFNHYHTHDKKYIFHYRDYESYSY